MEMHPRARFVSRGLAAASMRACARLLSGSQCPDKLAMAPGGWRGSALAATSGPAQVLQRSEQTLGLDARRVVYQRVPFSDARGCCGRWSIQILAAL